MTGESWVKRVGQWPARLKEYIDDLRSEMRRVTWPSAKQVRATSLVVIATVFVFAGYFFVVDALVGQAVTRVFDAFAR